MILKSSQLFKFALNEFKKDVQIWQSEALCYNALTLLQQIVKAYFEYQLLLNSKKKLGTSPLQ